MGSSFVLSHLHHFHTMPCHSGLDAWATQTSNLYRIFLPRSCPLTFTITSGRHQFHSTIFSSVIVVTVLVQHELAPCSVGPVLPDGKSARLACTFTVQSFHRLPQAKSGEMQAPAASRRCCCVESVWKSSPTSWQPLRLRSGLVLVSRCNLLQPCWDGLFFPYCAEPQPKHNQGKTTAPEQPNVCFGAIRCRQYGCVCVCVVVCVGWEEEEGGCLTSINPKEKGSTYHANERPSVCSQLRKDRSKGREPKKSRPSVLAL